MIIIVGGEPELSCGAAWLSGWGLCTPICITRCSCVSSALLLFPTCLEYCLLCHFGFPTPALLPGTLESSLLFCLCFPCSLCLRWSLSHSSLAVRCAGVSSALPITTTTHCTVHNHTHEHGIAQQRGHAFP